MRIYYVLNANPGIAASGVYRKVASKLKWLTNMGWKGTLVLVSRSEISLADLLPGEYQVQNIILKPTLSKGLFSSKKYMKMYYNILTEYFKKQDMTGAFIFMRYTNASAPLLDFTKKHGKKIVLEHNTKELEEIVLNLEANEKKKNWFKLGSWLTWYEYEYLPVRNEKKLAKKIFSNIFGGVCVTKEIEEYEKKRSPGYNVCTITNSIETEGIKTADHDAHDAGRLELFMLSGAKAHWHGVDRVLTGLKNYCGTTDIAVYFYGDFYDAEIQMAEEMGLLNTKVFFRGPVNPASHVLKKHHLAFGTLAVHRKGLHEISALKIRECFARGFPVVYAGYDSDISATEELKKFSLRVDSTDEPLNFESITDFYNEVFSTENLHEKMYNLACKYLSTRNKMKDLVKFLAPEPGNA